MIINMYKDRKEEKQWKYYTAITGISSRISKYK